MSSSQLGLFFFMDSSVMGMLMKYMTAQSETGPTRDIQETVYRTFVGDSEEREAEPSEVAPEQVGVTRLRPEAALQQLAVLAALQVLSFFAHFGALVLYLFYW